MFGLFKKKAPEQNLRKGVDVGEMRQFAMQALLQLTKSDPEFSKVDNANPLSDLHFDYHGMSVFAPFIGGNSMGLLLRVTVPECNIRAARTTANKAFAYRCLDHVSRTCRGVRAHFHPDSGDLLVGVESAGFGEQYRADTLIDIALYMLEQGVMEARKYLGLPHSEVEPPKVDQYDGGYHYGEGFTSWATAPDAVAKFMEKKYQSAEVERSGFSIVLESGPVRYEVLRFGWPSGYEVVTATKGFRHAYLDDERYVRIQERLAQDIHDLRPERVVDQAWNFRDPRRTTLAYFQEDGTFILGEYGFGHVRTDANGEAFEAVVGAETLNLKYMTLLVEALPDDLYSDETNRPN